MKFTFFLFLTVACTLVTYGDPSSCRQFFQYDQGAIREKIAFANAQLTVAANNTSIQATVAADYFIRSMRTLFELNDFSTHDMGYEVNFFSQRLSEASAKVGQSDSVLKKIDSIKEKIKIIKEKKFSLSSAIRGRGEQYLNSVAHEIKSDFKIIQEESRFAIEQASLIDALDKDIFDYLVGLEYRLNSLKSYNKEIADATTRFQKEFTSGNLRGSVESNSLLLNQLMSESNSSFQQQSLVESSVRVLKTQLGAVKGFKRAAYSMSEIELPAFLKETGLTPTFIENEITQRTKAIEAKQLADAIKKHNRDRAKNLMKGILTVPFIMPFESLVVAVAVGVGGFGINEWVDPVNLVKTEIVKANHPAVDKAFVEQSKLSGADAKREFLYNNLNKLEGGLSVSDFLVYVSRRNLDIRDSYDSYNSKRDLVIYDFFRKRLASISPIEAEQLSQATKSYQNDMMLEYFEFKKTGVMPTKKPGD